MNNCWIWIQYLLFSIISIQIVHLLKCDSQIVDRQNDEKLKSIYRKCLRNESDNSKQTKSNDKVEFDVNGYDYTSDEYEQDHSSKDNRESNIKAGRSGKDIIRVRRQYQDQRHSRKNNNSDGNRNPYNSYENVRNNQLPSECLIQCIFQEMGLVNSNQFAEKNKVISFMITTTNDLDYRDFVINSVNECFHYLEYNHVNDKCEFSKNLADCLAERASVNCDHWNKKNVLF